MAVKWIIDKKGVGRTKDGDEKQFPEYDPPELRESHRKCVLSLKTSWDPSYWHGGNTAEDLNGFGKT